MRFKKAVLKVGKYKSPDGEVDVTADRLKHWAAEFSRLKSAKQIVPIDWDHASAATDLQPLTLDQYAKKRSAKNTVGHLVDFKANGDQAELTLEVPDGSAADKAAKNLVYVSPVIFPSWKDGAGNEYRDCITHVDFVNHPVDHSQGPFVAEPADTIACALRMGLSKPYRLGETMADDDTKTADDETDDTPAGSDGGDDDSSDTLNDDSGKLQDVMAALAQMNIVLSEDTTTENFLSHIHQALLTAAAHCCEDKPGNPADGADKTMVADPGAAGATALSLEVRGTVAWAETKHRQDVSKRLRSLLDDGRCQPAEFKIREASTAAVKLSLDQSGQPLTSDLEKWIESREAVPKGTFWDPEQRTRLSAEAAPVPMSMAGGTLSEAEVKAAADWALGRNPAAK